MPDDTGSIHLPGSAIVLDDSDINLCVRWKETRSSILIAVTSDFFRPAMEFSEDAAVTIDYGDGSVPQVHNIDSAEFAFDRYEFQDSSGEHEVEISVSPWESLSVLNLGFRGGDGGQR